VSNVGARQPPAADLDRPRRPAHVDDAVELIVAPVARREVGRARAAVDVLAVHPPQVMHAARGRARRVEERHAAGLGRISDVEDLESRGFEIWRARLVRHHEQVADQIQRVGAHPVVRKVGLRDQRRLLGIGDVDGRDVLRRRLVGDPQDAPAVAAALDGHALAAIAEAVEGMVGEEADVARALSCHGGRMLRQNTMGG